MATSAAFEDAYKRLNAKQKEAVDTLYGPVIVVAGPGTGKTQMLALRIGNILLKSTGTKPDEILALTFTESAVAALRTRLGSFIGSAAHRVRIHTFHGFAQSILELRPDLFPRIAEGTHLSNVRGAALILTNGQPVTVNARNGALPNVLDTFSFMGQGYLFSIIPMQLVFFAIIAVLAWLVLSYSNFGFRVYAVGGSAKAARVSGISVNTVKIWAFVLMGLALARKAMRQPAKHS